MQARDVVTKNVVARIGQELYRERVERIPAQEVKTMTAVGYARQGEQELRQGKKGIDIQTSRIGAFVRSQKWNLSAMYQDIAESGDNLDRPGLLEWLSHPDFQVLVVDTTDRLARKKRDLDFLLALLNKLGITCIAATWSWDYLAQYMRHYYRTKGNKIYAQLDQNVT